VRRICRHCKAEKQLSDGEIKSLSEIIPPELLSKHERFYAGKGCPACNETGYLGRVGLHEVMEIDDTLRDAILTKTPARELRDKAIAQGMVPMIDDGFYKASNGFTTIEEVLRMRHE
jgi:type IV pilus assembly protein PilB